MTGIVNGLPGARRFRRLLTEESVKPGAGLEVLYAAIEAAWSAENRLTAPDAATRFGALALPQDGLPDAFAAQSLQ